VIVLVLAFVFLAARLDDFVGVINDNIQALSLEIRKAIDETSARPYWGFVNMKADTHIQTATKLSTNDLALFKKLVDLIVSDEAGCITAAVATTAGKDVAPPFTATRAQALIDQLCRAQWLADLKKERNEERKITLGVRSMLELRAYLEELYKDELKDCTLCSEPVLLRNERGTQCSNPPCSARMHSYCRDKWFHGKANKRCPACTTLWPGYEENEANIPPPQRTGGQNRANNRAILIN